MYKLFTILFFCFSQHANSQGFLRADGKVIRNEQNQEIILKGMGLGGWMLQEPYMLRLSGAAKAQYDIRNKIQELIGEEKTRQFYDAWLRNHCTKADIDSLAIWGFNSVRLPMHYNLYTLPVEKEPVKGKHTWLQPGFALTDSLLSWCAQNKIYLILDLHAAPGGQGNDIPISDRDASLPSLWESGANQQKTIALWKELAKRYKDEPWIGGYDLINEPNWGFKNGENINGCEEKENKPLLALHKDITKAIREVDKKHIIFAEGNCWGNNYEGMFPLWDNNLVLSFHKYWNFNDDASIRKFLDYRDKYNVPIWLGETGENSNAWFTGLLSLLDKHKIGWAMWPMKKSGINNLLQVPIDDDTQWVFDYWKGKSPRPAADAAFKSLLRFAGNTHIDKNIIRHDVIDAMFRQVYNPTPVPYKMHKAAQGSIIFATDYDMGPAGIAYHDKDSAEYWVSTNQRTGWNNGRLYRNDGVDIEACTDKITNGYNVGWIQDGEWMQYSIFSDEPGEFDIRIRSSAKESPGKMKLLADGKEIGTMNIPVTGGTQQWSTQIMKSVSLKKGWNTIRLQAITGGYNLNYLQFNSPGLSAGVK